MTENSSVIVTGIIRDEKTCLKRLQGWCPLERSIDEAKKQKSLSSIERIVRRWGLYFQTRGFGRRVTCTQGFDVKTECGSYTASLQPDQTPPPKSA